VIEGEETDLVEIKRNISTMEKLSKIYPLCELIIPPEIPAEYREKNTQQANREVLSD
jgi:hypothetical protein